MNNDELKKIEDYFLKMEKDYAEIEQEILPIFQKYFGNKSMWGQHNFSKVMAEILMKYKTCSLNFELEYIIGHVFESQVEDLIKRLDNLYEHLEKRHEYNDLDNAAWRIDPKNGWKVICITGQTIRYVYIWTHDQYYGKPKVHIRRFYDKYNNQEIWGYSAKPHSHKTKITIKNAIKIADHFLEFADDDNKYVSRPSLNWFKKRNFIFNHGPQESCGYGDCRDIGYVFSSGGINPQNLHVISNIDSALWEINSLECEFNNGNKC